MKLTALIIPLALFGLAAPATFAATYACASWSFPTSTTAMANIGAGSISLSVSGSSPFSASSPIQFQSADFTPTVAQAVGVANMSGSSPQQWTVSLDFTTFTDTAGQVVGFGNFAHDVNLSLFPGYRLTAFDTANNPMSLTGINVIGSYDYTTLADSAFYNDNTSLDLATGLFSVATVTGGADVNSDILLLSLPSGIGRLNIAPISASAQDGLSIIAVVPEPSSALTLCLSSLALLRRRRAKN